MHVEIISVSEHKAAPMRAIDAVALVAGKGIVGDRKYGLKRHPGQNLTLVEAEQIESFNRQYHASLSLLDTRRNVVTRGVRLNDLVGRQFWIGEVLLRGVELCEPCGTLARYLAGAGGLSRPQFLRALAHRCGLRADVLSSGVIRPGASLRTDPPAGAGE